MHGAAAVEGITTDAEAALELVMDQWRRERQRLKRHLQAVGEGVAGNRRTARFHSPQPDERAALAGPRRAEPRRQLIEIDPDRREEVPKIAAACAGGLGIVRNRRR